MTGSRNRPGHEVLTPGLPDERCILTAEARASLPKGTITVGADDRLAVADGLGGFQDVGLEGSYSPEESKVLPAYIIAGPDLPVLIPGAGAVISSQTEVDQLSFGFHGVGANGSLFSWEWLDNWEAFGPMIWAAAGQSSPSPPGSSYAGKNRLMWALPGSKPDAVTPVLKLERSRDAVGR